MTVTYSRRQAGVMLGGAALAPIVAQQAWARTPPACPVRAPLDAVADRLLALTPETAAYNGVAAALDGGPLARRMDDYSPAGEAAWRSGLKAARDDIAAIRCEADPESALRLGVAAAVLENATRSSGVSYGRINAFSFSGHVPYIVNQISGPAIDTPNLMQAQQSLATPAAIDAWIEKLDGYETGFRGVAEKLAADEAAGCRPPRALLAGALSVLESFIAGPGETHPLVAALRERTAAAGLDANFRAKAEARALTALERRARPAYARLRDAVAAMLPRGREEAGVWAQTDGEALYAANIRALGDSSLAPPEIHRIGLDEVTRITADMDRRLKARGLSRGGVGARMDALAADPANQFADSDAGRAALLDYLRGLVRDMEKRYPELLPATMIPRQTLEVRRVPVATQDGAPGGFYDGPSLDGSRPGTYWINLRDMKAVAKFRLPTLSYHEGVPGHHTQGAIALGLGEAPLLLRIANFNAYQEGWALYCERLAAEMGMYARDPLGDLGRLQDELFRAVRLVVDTGMHHQRWSREKAIAYMRDATGIAETRVVAEIERYMAWPGQALGYKLGQIRLLDIREKYRRAKGKRFSRKAYHGIVLGHGAMPLDLVEKLVLGG